MKQEWCFSFRAGRPHAQWVRIFARE